MLMKNFAELITALSTAIDAKDNYTEEHSYRVAQIAGLIAAKKGCSDEERRLVHTAGMLHDVGKIAVPQTILNKPGKLTAEEFEIIKVHTVAGYHILHGISWDERIAEAAKYHHERYDGKGYPTGLQGEDIPEFARIIGVADSFDAMTSRRSYRNAMHIRMARAEIEDNLGKQFDPDIGRIFIDMLDNNEIPQELLSRFEYHILIVDDEDINIEILKNILEQNPGYIIEYCTNGIDALKRAEKGGLDLILLDIYMPGMDGFAVLEEMKKRKMKIPAALLTSDRNISTMRKAALYGVEDYVTKPYTSVIVSSVVRSILSEGRKKRMMDNIQQDYEEETTTAPDGFAQAGISLDDLLSHCIGNRDLAMRMLKKFRNDKSFSELAEAMGRGDHDAAFKAAHALKGVSGNLGMTKLYEADCLLTDALRGGADREEAERLYPVVCGHYDRVMSFLATLG